MADWRDEERQREQRLRQGGGGRERQGETSRWRDEERDRRQGAANEDERFGAGYRADEERRARQEEAARYDAARYDVGGYGSRGPAYGAGAAWRAGQRAGYGGRGWSGEAGRQGEERSWWDRAGDEVASWFGDEEAERRRHQDQSRRGRGPKGYVRSDERIREDVNDRLTDDWHLDASEIEVAVGGSEVTLAGSVASREEKRRAEDLAESVSGVKHVQNNLRVQAAGNGSAAGNQPKRSGL